MSANGQLAASELTTVQGTLTLAKSTAKAWLAMKVGASADGVSLTIVAPGGAYLSRAMQTAMHNDKLGWHVNPNVTLAAVGTMTHGYGTCVDINPTSAALEWVREHGGRYGFTFSRAAVGDINHLQHAETTTSGTTENPIGDTMQLDAGDQAFLNSLGAAIIDQISGNGAYVNGTLTVAQLRRDLGYLAGGTAPESADSLKAIHAAIVTKAAASIDLDALAAKIAPLVKLTPADVAQLVKAVNDDAAERMKA